VIRVIASPRRRERGFSFIEVIIAMSVLVVGSVAVLGLFALGVNRMVERRVAVRTEQMRPEIGSILQAAVDLAGERGLPEPITREKPHPLSRRGYALAATWHPNPFEPGEGEKDETKDGKGGRSRGSSGDEQKSGEDKPWPGVVAHAELLYQGQRVNMLIIPFRRSFLAPYELEDMAKKRN
jgi:prepilin-type N-terminal cleavage/methylation domain-containing protein